VQCAIPRTRLERTHGGTADTHSLRYHLHGLYNVNGRLKRLYNSVMLRRDATIANSE
jgi:hypothetical protein